MKTLYNTDWIEDMAIRIKRDVRQKFVIARETGLCGLVYFTQRHLDAKKATSRLRDFARTASIRRAAGLWDTSKTDKRKSVVHPIVQRRAQLYREYLASQLLVLLCVLMLRYLRLVMQVMAVSRRKLFRASAFPCGVINRSIHDRRYAVFRRRAVGYLLPIPVCHVDQRETSPQSAGGIKGHPPVRTAFPVRSAGEATTNFTVIQLKLDGKKTN